MIKRKVYGKLVRDLIPTKIKSNFSVCRVFSRKSRVLLLAKKMEEETKEMLQAFAKTDTDGVAWELADMYEIVKAIAEENGYTMEDIENKAKIKRLNNGGFEKGYFLDWVEVKEEE